MKGHERMIGLIGLCARAGRIVSGEQGVLLKIRSGGARLVLVDRGASANTKKSLTDACAHYGVPIEFMESDALGVAIGKPGRMAAAVTDGPLADQIWLYFQQTSIEHRGGALRE